MRGFNFKMLAATAALLTCGLCYAEQIDNPQFKNWNQFGKGTTVTLKNEMDMGTKMTTTMTYTLLDKAADVLTLETKSTMMMGDKPMEMPAQKIEVKAKIDKVDPPAGTTKPDIKESTEEVEVGGKKVKAKVIEMTMDMNGTKTKTKSWTSDEVPGALIKSESVMEGTMKGTTKMAIDSVTIKK